MSIMEAPFAGSLGHHEPDYKDQLGVTSQRDTTIQIVLSAVLGIGAFLGFCFLRPRWKSLYQARKRQRNEASPLPDLPDSFFGWIPGLWKITEQQVLASAGLDAYVFLRFFKLACKFLSITLFFSLVIFKPVHDAFPEPSSSKHRNGTDNSTAAISWHEPFAFDADLETNKDKSVYDKIATDYLWMYLVFVYVLSGIVIYLLVTETERIIAIRQQFLGSLHTVTDRTIRLSGIPVNLRSEEKIKDYIEDLGIGKVDSVTLCRRWEQLDDCVQQRMNVLRKLEEAWTVFLSQRRVERNSESLPISQPPPPGPRRYRDEVDDDDENNDGEGNGDELLLSEQVNGQEVSASSDQKRPKATLRYGFLKLRYRKVDAIDYYEDVLAGLDERIRRLREQEFEPTPLAFVTMDSVAACQMAVQAVIDPSPMQLIAKVSPAPADVLWRNTYMPRWQRMSRAWIITIIISFLTIFWSLVLVPLATALNLESIHRVWPQLASALKSHPFARSLVETQLPTLVSSLLFVLVPYLYDYLANRQGMTSQGDVDMSVISKNFFFVFFNYFVVFTLLGTVTTFYEFTKNFEDALKDTTKITYTLAQSLQGLLPFYTNLIILQGVGLFPFRLLEFGSVALYPIYRMGSKTPRDYAELVQPPTFYYGFYLPQVMLIFIICVVYSCLRESWKVLLAGLVYFVIGGFVYKYQLLYAMDHRQQATGRGWIMICNRMIVGLLLFQLNMIGQLALKGAFTRAVVVVPLFMGTVWFSYAYARGYEPLMRFISLGSIERTRNSDPPSPLDPDGWGDQAALRHQAETRPGHTVDESPETGTRFINPSLVAPLEDVWIADKEVRNVGTGNLTARRRMEGALNAGV